MVHLTVVLIGTKYTGNLGAVARVMMNFGFKDLIMVDPPELDDDALARAMHAKKILYDAERCDSLDEILQRFDLVIGTSGIGTLKERHFLRHSEDPETFASDISTYHGSIALLFGREDIGLKNSELMSCDRLITIPTSDEYPIMNLSHSVSVILYELFKQGVTATGVKKDEEETLYSMETKKRLFTKFSNVLKIVDYPEHKRERTEIMFKKILGRATVNHKEYHRLMGVFTYIEDELSE